MSILTEPHRRRTVVTAVVASSTLLLGGCSFWAPNTAIEPYAPSYGLQSGLGEDLVVRDVLVVSEGDGEAGVLSAGIVNRGLEDVTVVIEVGGTTDEVDLPARSSVLVGVPEPAEPDLSGSPELVTVVIDSVEPIAGDVVPVVMSEASAGSVTLRAPIYLPEGIYEGLTPPADG